MPQLSATIIAQNEARHIARAIRSLACTDEIVVVDGGSTDQTAGIAARLGARVVSRSFTGFADQKNYASAQARHDWILSLDADEALDEAAQAALRAWKSSEPRAVGYRFARRPFYLGRRIGHSGWYPDHKLRLYDRRKGSWQGAYVHESVEVAGPVETLPGEILHDTCDSLGEHRRRIEFYTDLAAREMIETGAVAGAFWRWLAPPWTFFSTYVLRLGALDGLPGFWISWMAARYVRRKYAKWLALARARDAPTRP